MGDSETAPPPPAVPAGWYPDPDGSANERYFDGIEWTDLVGRPPAPRVTTAVLGWMAFAYTVAIIGLIYALWPYGVWPL